MQNLFGFISYVVITTYTPGPNNIMSMSNSSRYGFKRSLQFGFGVISGFFVIMLLSSLFSKTLIDFIPSIKLFMLIIGAAYILHLAWKTYKSKPEIEDRMTTNSFKTGFLLQFVNPKLILYGITTFSSFIVPNFSGLGAILLFCIGLTIIGYTSIIAWSAFGSVFHAALSKNYKVLNLVMALLLVYCAVSLFL